MKKKIIDWIRRQVKQARVKGVVLGLSGGIDSAVVAALCRQALGPKRVLALIMPCQSLNQDLLDAKLVAKKLKIRTKTVDLSKACAGLLRILPKARGLAFANVKPRLRMLTLYYFANKLNYLVVGTGNKSEMMLGYFTKHGDGATDILPIGGLLKSQVRALAKELNIPRRIITKAPSAGLWPGQTDEAEIGISYKEIDDFLGNLKKGKAASISKSKVRRIKAKIKSSEHKRLGPKVCKI